MVELKYKKIDINDFCKHKGEFQIIDIRKTYQYNGWDTELSVGGHIPNAVVFPEDWLPSGNINPFDTARLNFELSRIDIDKKEKTLIYGDNSLSNDAIYKYTRFGFSDLYILDGGINSYYKANLPLEKMKNYKVLVHPNWVVDLVNGGEFKIIEIGNSMESFKESHIKGAIFSDTSVLDIRGPRFASEYESIPIEEKQHYWNIPFDSVIKENLEKLGISKDTTTIVYASDRTSTLAAARFLTILLYSGVKDVRFLDGGKTYAKAYNMPMEKGLPKYTPISDFGKIEKNDNIIGYKKELELVDNDKAAIVSVRCWEEYIGIESGYTFIDEAGEIKSAKFGYSGTSMADFRNPDNTMFSYKHIKDRWGKWGITPDKFVSFHCGTGYRASEAFIYAWAMGWEDIHVYDGGWYQWGLYDDSPRMKKGLPCYAPETEPGHSAGIPIINYNVLRNFS